MTEDQLAEVFESEVAFPWVPSVEEMSITRCTLAWMKDSGLSDEEILKAMSAVKEQYISPDLLPDSVWNGSLLKRGEYYCHHALQLISRADIIKSDGTFIHYPFYQEMKILFTIEDLVSYFYHHIRQAEVLRDDKRAAAQLQYMLEQYSHLDEVQAVDLLLFLIDEAVYQRIPVMEPFSLKQTELVAEVADKVKRIMDRRKAEKTDHVTWRTYILRGGEITWQRKQKK